MWRAIKVLLVVVILTAFYRFSSRFTVTQHHFFVPLAQSFLHGKLYVTKMEFALHEMVSEKEIVSGIPEEPVDGVTGKYYVIYPPMPAVILLPFVKIGGADINQSLVSVILAALSVYVAYLVFRELRLDRVRVKWLVGLYAFGSMLWYHASVGSAWYLAQVCGLLFLWLSILGSLRKWSWFGVGIMLGCAYLSRFPLILSLPFFLLWRQQEWWKKQKLAWKPIVQIGVGLGIFVFLLFVYNYVRYGTIGNYGYYLLEHRWYNVANEYAKGSYDLSYLPRHIHALFLALPKLITRFPYVVPNMTGMALWLVFPAILVILKAPWKQKIVWASSITVLGMLPASLFHGGIGASQFGYRYALDYLPFLLLIIAETIREKFVWWQKGLFILSILINAWGMYAIFWLA